LGALFNKAGRAKVSSTFQAHLDALVRSQARALFLYGADDEEYKSFQFAEREIFPRLKQEARRRIAVEIWSGRVHSPYEVTRQQQVAERIIAFARSFHPHLGQLESADEGLRASA
jgi:hypothetical protein